MTALPLNACMNCWLCRDGLHSLCAENQFTGVGRNPGAYAEYVLARSAMLQRLPAGVGFREGALVEPLAVAFHAVDRAEMRPGTDVLVLGAGPIGVGVAMFAALAGARRVVVSEFAADRRRRALDAGATHAIDPAREDPARRFAEIAGGPPPIVFECVGVPGMVAQAVGLCRPRGRVVIVGVCFGTDQFQPLAALSRELSLQFANCYSPRDFEIVVDLIDQHRAQPRPMVTDVVGFDDFPAAFEALRTPGSQCKVLLDPAL